MPGPIVPAAEEAAWMLSHPSDDRGPDVRACAAICLVLATVFLALRLWSRIIVHGRFCLDVSDWIAVMAWVCRSMRDRFLIG